MKTFFAGIVAAIATLFGGTSQAPLPPDSMPAATAAAVTTHTVTPSFAASDPATATTTIVNNYVTSPVVERIVETRALTTSVLDEKIQALRNDMLLRIAQIASPAINFSGPAASTPVSVASFAASQNIDSLNNVTLTNVTVTGVAGLTDGDIPDAITASNYLPLTGGSLTFASSTLFSVFNNAYFGATATSSFNSAGALTLATPLLVSSGGTGWTNINAGSILFGNGSSAIATSSSLYWDNTNTRLGIGTTTPWANLSIQAADNAPIPQLVVGSSTATSLIVTSSGNVGIGTTTPDKKLSIQNGAIGFYDATGVLHAQMFSGAAGSSNKQFYVAAFTATTSARDIFDNWAIFYFAGSQNKIQLGHNGTGAWIEGGGSSLNFANAINSTSNPAMTIAGSSIGIGTTNPNQGKVEVKGGTVCVDTDSNDDATSCIASESDERLKTNIQPLAASSSLSTVLALNPVSFDWRATDPEVLAHYPLLARFASSTHSIGLVAQQVAPLVPEAIEQEKVGDAQVQYLQLDYTKFIPHLIAATKELYARVQDVAQEVAGFANVFATKDLTYVRAEGDYMGAKEVSAHERLCVGATCVTESQLQGMLAAAGETGTTPQTLSAGDTSPALADPPVITIAGENPAHIHLGDTYNDLGALAKDSAGHDLSVKTFLNGALVSDIVLDTSAVATDTVDYVATDGEGDTSTSTRTVIVEAQVLSPSAAGAPISAEAPTSQ